MKTFKLFASCIPVKGAKRHVICDLTRSEIFFIPEGVYEILTLHKNRSVDEIKAYYEFEVNEQIDNYIEYLVKNELGFLTAEPDSFPELDLSWDHPSLITNAIIERSKSSSYDVKDVVNQLESLGCKFLEIRCYDEVDRNEVTEMIKMFNETKFRSVNLVLKYHTSFFDWNFEMFLVGYQRVSQILIHSVPVHTQFKPTHNRVSITTNQILDNSCCGQVSPVYFKINLPMFTESIGHNSCLNRKISITRTGEIKNCPSTVSVFGNIESSLLKDVISQKEFTAIWGINKDQISTCKDCEFRYICQDCRAFLSNQNDIFSKPLKCGYDPYTAQWQEANADIKFNTKILLS